MAALYFDNSQGLFRNIFVCPPLGPLHELPLDVLQKLTSRTNRIIIVRHKNMGHWSRCLETKSDCADGDQKRFTRDRQKILQGNIF
jgi:hypothetical protein